MGRPRGSKNKQQTSVPWPMNLSTKERIELLANIIVDRIIEDQKEGGKLLKDIKKITKSAKEQ